jgi:hypothetical protein
MSFAIGELAALLVRVPSVRMASERIPALWQVAKMRTKITNANRKTRTALWEHGNR